jgi:hypothetical protein
MALTVLMARIVVSLLVTGKMGFLMLVMKKWIIKYLLDLHWRSRAPDLVFYIGLDRRQDPAPRQSNNITACLLVFLQCLQVHLLGLVQLALVCVEKA